MVKPLLIKQKYILIWACQFPFFGHVCCNLVEN